MFIKYRFQKPSKKNWSVFLEELQAPRIFSKVSVHFNKIPNSLRQVLQTYSEICIFVYHKKSPPEAFGDGWSQSARGIMW